MTIHSCFKRDIFLHSISIKYEELLKESKLDTSKLTYFSFIQSSDTLLWLIWFNVDTVVKHKNWQKELSVTVCLIVSWNSLEFFVKHFSLLYHVTMLNLNIKEHCLSLETNLGEGTLEWVVFSKRVPKSPSTNRKWMLMNESEKIPLIY